MKYSLLNHAYPTLPIFLLGVASLAGVACGGSDATDDDEAAVEAAENDGRCNEDCVVDLMRQIAKIPRPSGKEDKLRDFIKARLADAVARGTWSASEVAADVDAAGNLLVRLPATGRFRDKRLKPIAIQAHMDMVLAVADARPGDALEPYFANGVDLVEENGIMHSRDLKTTLGADDGVGVVQEIRYLLDRSLSHPPLELVFTTQEEASAVGAINYDAQKMPLRAGVFISLDGMTFDLASGPAVGIGAQGAVNANMDAKLPSAELAGGTKQLKLTLKGLRGGHSGNAIHESRLNSMRALGALTLTLSGLQPEARFVEVTIGDVKTRKGLNKIPDAFSAVFAVDAGTNVEAIRTALGTQLRELLAQSAAEVPASVSFVVEEIAASPASAITSDLTVGLANAIVSVPNGILHTDSFFPNGVAASSSIDILGISGATPEKAFYLGYLPRAFDTQRALDTTDQIFRTFGEAIRAGRGSEPSLDKGVVYPWLIDAQQSKLVALARRATPNLPKTKMSGGYQEVGIFWSKFPQLNKDNTMGIWCAITDPHTPKESLNVKSLRDSAAALQKVLEGIGDDGTFLR